MTLTLCIRSSILGAIRFTAPPQRQRQQLFISSSRFISALHTRPLFRRPSTLPRANNSNKMASIIQSTASAAHAAFASLTSAAPVKAGDPVPDVEVRIDDLEKKLNFSKLPGKNILVLVPGAFTPTCSSQVPGYIEQYAEFKAAGVNHIYVVSVNDIFVVNAWKKNLLSAAVVDVASDDTVKFTADDQAVLAHALGLVLNAQGLLGGPRLKRGVIVIENGKVLDSIIEPDPGAATVSQADAVLKTLK